VQLPTLIVTMFCNQNSVHEANVVASYLHTITLTNQTKSLAAIPFTISVTLLQSNAFFFVLFYLYSDGIFAEPSDRTLQPHLCGE
jgi:hypothetical protein